MAGPGSATGSRPAPPVRVGIRLAGRVQGVGLRPWLAARAHALGLSGRVRNEADGVALELEGSRDAIARFERGLAADAPPAARIVRTRRRRLPARGERGFRIAASRGLPSAAAEPAPDSALCDACLAELFDPGSRRHRHAFLHCARCGPRASLLLALPWDRPGTTLARFAPCAACRREHDDPGDRRHHAQTIACPDCGPRLAALGPDGAPRPGDPVEAAAACLASGGVVAALGYGGFHLLADASREDVVRRLRARKCRPAKPLALLVPDLAGARRLVRLGAAHAALLSGPARPVLVAPRHGPGLPVADAVAPGLDALGVALPCAPVHWLLLFAPGARPGCDRPRFEALVFTSGNRSGEPTLHTPEDAVAALAGVADLFLVHDRPVARPSDDSVLRVVGDEAVVLRASRGLAPQGFTLPDGLRAAQPIWALGGDLKCAPALAAGGRVLLAEHVGDLDTVAAQDALVARTRALASLVGVAPEVVAFDPHPGAAGAALARGSGLAPEPVGHHHAHAAACLVEHGLAGPALAVVLDGLGFGADGTLWGGELLRVTLESAERRAHLETVPLPGGDAATRAPWRMAAAWLEQAFAGSPPRLPWHARRTTDELAAVRHQVRTGLASPPIASCGRLFDAVASLLGLCDVASYEAEAAMRLEASAGAARGPIPALAAPRSGPKLASPGSREGRPGAPAVVHASPLLRALVRALLAGGPIPTLARAFHDGLAALWVAAVRAEARASGLRTVLLTGGCLHNAILAERLAAGLRAAGLDVRQHRALPPGDGGLAVGQAAVAAARRARAQSPPFQERSVRR